MLDVFDADCPCLPYQTISITLLLSNCTPNTDALVTSRSRSAHMVTSRLISMGPSSRWIRYACLFTRDNIQSTWSQSLSPIRSDLRRSRRMAWMSSNICQRAMSFIEFALVCTTMRHEIDTHPCNCANCYGGYGKSYALHFLASS
jgi:hypothetical protein